MSASGTVVSPARASASVPAVFALTALGSFLVSMDVSITNALLPAIGDSFSGATRAATSWTISAYAITFAAALVPAGRVADRAGRRRTFAGGLALFAFGSLICGVAPDLAVLLVGRVLQAVGAAAAAPASLGLLLAVTEERRRSTFAARWAASGAVGIGLGPVIGGAFESVASWRWAFLVNLPLIALALALVPRVLVETPRAPGRALPDPPGAALLAGAASCLVLGISELPHWGVADPRTLGCWAIGLVAGAAFWRRCRRVDDPLLDLALLARRAFAVTTVATIAYSAGFFGLLLSFVLFLTSAWGLTTVEAGLGIVPMAGMVVLVSLGVGGLAERTGYGPVLSAGATLIAAGLLLDVALQHGDAFRAGWLAIAALIGLGIGLCYLLLGAAAVAEAGPDELAAATAINTCARQLGAALGVAAVVAALGTGDAPSVAHFHLAWVLCASFCAVAAVTALALPDVRRR